jgi:hypothetical protein
MRERRGVYRVLVEKHEGKRRLGRPRRRREDNGSAGSGVGGRGMELINLVRDRGMCRALVNAAVDLNL